MGETDRLTLREAAEIIEIPLDALRKRVYRGSIPADKVDGQYTVLRSDAQRLAPAAPPEDRTPGETVLGHGSDTGETPRSPNGTANAVIAAKDETISRQDAEIVFLRNQNENLRQQMAAERERFDVIHREALHRIEALTAGDQVDDTTGDLDQVMTDKLTMPLIASPADPGREEAVSTTPDTSHQPSIVASAWRRLRRRT